MKTKLTLLACTLLAACAGPAPTPSADGGAGATHPAQHSVSQPAAASAAHAATPLAATRGEVLTGNDAAFAAKLEAVKQARRSIDMAYYIFGDDYSSSALAQALIEAARRGVKIRLLLDYHTNYKRLDFYSMMESQGKGNLHVRFYNRPTRNVVQDAVYLTLGCGQALAAQGGAQTSGRCTQDKFAAIDRLFADEQVEGQPAAARNISNLNIGHSGLLLSGLYAKRADVIAMAVQDGQSLDLSKLAQGSSTSTPQDKEGLKKVARLYWNSKTAPAFPRLMAKAELYLALSIYGEKLNPLYEGFTGLLPTEKTFTEAAKQDWDHFTDFLHHKLLLVDETRLQTGGRNVEDAYHMRPNPLTAKYVFMDTDVTVDLTRGGESVRQSFDALWEFDAMVARLAEVRQHAPNDFVANLDAYAQAVAACKAQGPSKNAACVQRRFTAAARPLAQRIAAQKTRMERHAAIYRDKYLARRPADTEARFALDAGALLAIVENLPFDGTSRPLARRYGARVGEELQAGKAIHDVWFKALSDACARATPERPREVLLHTAYFFPPANMTHALARMVNGELDCANVRLTVLTNSIETTDLNIVNLMARHALKAFAEFYAAHSHPQRRARFDYFEYRPIPGQPNLSLHSKVSVLGEDLLIGSANADVRSLMMDSNIALLIRNAPQLHRAYGTHLHGILRDGARVQRMNDYFLDTPRETMVQEDLANLRKLFTKYKLDQRAEPGQLALLEQRFVELLGQVYDLTRQSIAVDSAPATREAQQNRFNERFKPI